MSYEVVVCEMKLELLRAGIELRGFLLCNPEGKILSKYCVGGDWNSIVALMESGEAFYTKMYKKRAGYLSRELYHQLKPYKQRTDKLSENARKIYEFLQAIDFASTQEIKRTLMMSSSGFNRGLNELSAELLITAVRRERTLNPRNGWCSFYWATASEWEKLKPESQVEQDTSRVYELLGTILPENELERLLR